MFGTFPLVMDLSRVLPLLLPILAIIGAFAVGIVAMLINSKQEERTHRERMFYAEKGLDVPKELYRTKTAGEKKRGDMRALRTVLLILGTVLIAVGIGVIILVSIRDGVSNGMAGVIPLLIGVGFMISERLINTTLLKNNAQL
jgi:hypothetical protein